MDFSVDSSCSCEISDSDGSCGFLEFDGARVFHFLIFSIGAVGYKNVVSFGEWVFHLGVV